MNAYFDIFHQEISNSRIIEGTFEERQTRRKQMEAGLRTLLSHLTAHRAFAKIKVASFLFCLLWLCGIVGSVECGRMELGIGFLLGLFSLGVEGAFLKLKLK